MAWIWFGRTHTATVSKGYCFCTSIYAAREADMFDKQARFWVGEFDGEKECAAGNEVSAITRHRIFVCGLGVGEGMVCCV